MAKKNTPDMRQYVKKETLYMACLLALAIGFFGGVMFGIFKSGPSGPTQAAAPVQPTSMPQSDADLSNEIAMLEREVAANPSNVAAWINLGNNYFDTAQHEKSIQAYRKALALAPNNANVWTDMGVMYRRSGQPKEAVKAFDKAVEVDPKHETSRFKGCHQSLGGAAAGKPGCRGAQRHVRGSIGCKHETAGGRELSDLKCEVN
jgi:cytochrome c-type biogenesis protein CcmH/NrfG